MNKPERPFTAASASSSKKVAMTMTTTMSNTATALKKTKRKKKVPEERIFRLHEIADPSLEFCNGLETMTPWTPETKVWDSASDSEEEEEEETSSSSEEEEEEEERSTGSFLASGNYRYKFPGSGDFDDDDLEYNDESKQKKISPASEEAREIMKTQIHYEYLRTRKEYLNPGGSYLRCPEGGDHFPWSFSRRRCVGPFVYCPVTHCSGAIFQGYKMRWKVGHEMPRDRRPPYLKVRPRVLQIRHGMRWRSKPEPLELNCKSCMKLMFHHHSNPEQHYFDYLDVIKYKGANPEALPPSEAFDQMLTKWSHIEERKKKKSSLRKGRKENKKKDAKKPLRFA